MELHREGGKALRRSGVPDEVNGIPVMYWNYPYIYVRGLRVKPLFSSMKQ